ncbi:iron-containing alcohol dehydrogenase family protein [Mitsuokella sp. oral taxon 131]|uniref:iron-containing alcohol dehydrogenase family protein n=1 Tax=Mitsuokella sp. oral taxon 131 TaxID=1321780 RepID=UPI0003F9BB1D|nr:iron-containing alcohol dehydrogenase family protein [Mitsuokella sp. oral taxon 131]
MTKRYTVSFPNYTIGEEAYDKIREICPRYGKTVVVIGGREGVEAAQEKMVKAVEGVGLEFTGFIHASGQTTRKAIARIANDSAVAEADMIFAVGGGKVIDTAKAVAHTVNKPYFTFPTVAGSCAASASIATVYEPDGRFREYLYSIVPPVHVFICTRILVHAPVEVLRRGIGDTMAKFYEAQIASRGKTLCHRDGMGIALSKMCAEPLYAYGAQALEDNRQHRASLAFEETVLAVIITSGLVSNLAAPEYNGHIAHALFVELGNLSAREQCRQHGGLVAYGILLLLLCDGQVEEFERFFRFCRRIGLPTCRKDIGAGEDDIHRVFQATEKKQDVRIMPYKITQSVLLDAARKLETYHKNHQ